jgi:hypothetical protein
LAAVFVITSVSEGKRLSAGNRALTSDSVWQVFGLLAPRRHPRVLSIRSVSGKAVGASRWVAPGSRANRTLLPVAPTGVTIPPRTAALLRGGTGRQASLSSKLWFSKGLSGFPDDFPGLFVVSQHNELRVTKMVCVCPFQKVYAGYGLWSKPHAFLHLLRR